MLRRLSLTLAALALIGAGGFWLLTRPDPLPAATFAGLTGDAAAGEAVFWAGGCASCHAAEGASGDELLVLAGGRGLSSDFGTFRAPNISPDAAHGIGGWTLAQFGDAMLRGVSPDGQHYYPAFPYGAYRFAAPQDIADLWAYLQSLPASDRPNDEHALDFPYSIRRGVGLWKRFALPAGWAVAGDLTPEEERGRYLAEALAHCAECHTPRGAMGQLVRDRWLAGAPNPSGQGRRPGIAPGQLSWSEQEIAGYLATGFTPSFDTAGGTMAAVVASLSRLPQEDLRAIAAYLKRVPPAQ
jgi:mono/diheme cytochrome c family protein